MRGVRPGTAIKPHDGIMQVNLSTQCRCGIVSDDGVTYPASCTLCLTMGRPPGRYRHPDPAGAGRKNVFLVRRSPKNRHAREFEFARIGLPE
jgi:hypothetical protein